MKCQQHTDLLVGDQLDEFRELVTSAAVNAEHTLLVHRDAVQL